MVINQDAFDINPRATASVLCPGKVHCPCFLLGAIVALSPINRLSCGIVFFVQSQPMHYCWPEVSLMRGSTAVGMLAHVQAPCIACKTTLRRRGLPSAHGGTTREHRTIERYLIRFDCTWAVLLVLRDDSSRACRLVGAGDGGDLQEQRWPIIGLVIPAVSLLVSRKSTGWGASEPMTL